MHFLHKPLVPLGLRLGSCGFGRQVLPKDVPGDSVVGVLGVPGRNLPLRGRPRRQGRSAAVAVVLPVVRLRGERHMPDDCEVGGAEPYKDTVSSG
jgi:hypothetical protein